LERGDETRKGMAAASRRGPLSLLRYPERKDKGISAEKTPINKKDAGSGETIAKCSDKGTLCIWRGVSDDPEKGRRTRKDRKPWRLQGWPGGRRGKKGLPEGLLAPGDQKKSDREPELPASRRG